MRAPNLLLTVVGRGAGVLVVGASVTLRATATAGGEITGWYRRQVVDLLGISINARSAPVRALGATSSLKTLQAQGRLEETMSRLLDRSNQQSTTGSRLELFARMLDQIVPDEARILSALSDGSTSTLIHVRCRSMTGRTQVASIENMSLVGRTANLALPNMTPNYVSHLLSMRLLEVGPEDEHLKAEYEILAADMAILSAIKKASRGVVAPRVERQTIRLSLLGREFWAAVAGDTH